MTQTAAWHIQVTFDGYGVYRFLQMNSSCIHVCMYVCVCGCMYVGVYVYIVYIGMYGDKYKLLVVYACIIK